MEHAVTLMEMLGAREARAMRQQQLLEEYHLPVISFCLNIAGPVKNSPVLRRAFREGLERLACALLAGGWMLSIGKRWTSPPDVRPCGWYGETAGR